MLPHDTLEKPPDAPPTNRGSTLRRVLVISFAFLVYLWHAGPALGKGRLGHRVIAKFAERHLADKARAEIKALLEPGESLADCSTWADEVRGKMREHGTLALRRCPVGGASL